ncbi:MAG: Uma2 family endonuclease [Leptolyngbyaceae cyanobacterium HOT.MB2.61]|nr:Uma2 family endonuclease [Leptolyngbyaceae cyanobacterium HOT.MB2.61]
MTIASEKKVWTDEEFMALPDDGGRYELVDGEIVNMGNSGMEHGNIGTFLGGALEFYARPKRLGVTCDSSTAFGMKSGNKRSLDVSFVARDRLQGLKRLPKGFFQGAPDLAVEIISPNNTFEEIHQKLSEYLDNGCRLAWVINPDEQSVLVYHQPHPDRLLTITDVLDGENVVPGFTLPVAELFAELDF